MAARALAMVSLLCLTACGGAATPRREVIGTTLSEAPIHRPPVSRGYVVLEPARLQSDQLRCHDRSLSDVGYERTLSAAMSQVERVDQIAKTAYARPIYLGVRQCGPYRAVTMGDRYRLAKLVYDEQGTLIAAFASSDVLEQKCLVHLDEWTAHYGRRVDCTETDLVFPPR